MLHSLRMIRTDLTTLSPSLLTDGAWQPVISLGSDHHSIIVSQSRSPHLITSERRTFLNRGTAQPYRYSDSRKDFSRHHKTAASICRIAEIKPHLTENVGLENDPTDPRISELAQEYKINKCG